MSSIVLRKYPYEYDGLSADRQGLSLLSCFGLSLASAALLLGGLFSPVFALSAFVIHVCMLLFLTERDMFSQMAFLLPFAAIYKIGGFPTSLYTILLFILVAVLALKRKTIRCTTLFSVLILLAYLLVQFSGDFLTIVKLCAFLLLFLLFTERAGPDYLKKMTLLFSLGLITSSTMGLFKASLPKINYYLSQADSLYIDGVLYSRFTGLVSDPNYYSAGIMICLAALTVLYLKKELGIEYWLLFIILSGFGFLTYSKSFTLFYSLLVFVSAFTLLKAGSKKRRLLVIIGIAIVLSAVILAILQERIELINIMIRRFQTEDATTGRSALWLWYIDFLKQRPFTLCFGVGANNNMINGRAVHNFYLEIVY